MKPARALMHLVTWWQGDTIPILNQPASRKTRIIHGKIEDGHCMHILSVDNVLATYGYLATESVYIDEFSTRFKLNPADHFLWGGYTSPSFRGRGYQPLLIQSRINCSSAERLWSTYWIDNLASAKGFQKSGFSIIGVIISLNDQLCLVPYNQERAKVGAEVFKFKLLK